MPNFGTVTREFTFDGALQKFIYAHIEDMYRETPPESVHTLNLCDLQKPNMQCWSWRTADNSPIAFCALKRLGAHCGEIKSMRTDPEHRGKGLGKHVLRHLFAQARIDGIDTLYLETGNMEFFTPARKLYQKMGFIECGPFGDYQPDPISVFMMLNLPKHHNNHHSESP